MINPVDNFLDKKYVFDQFIREINNHNTRGIVSTISIDVKIYRSESGLSKGRENVIKFFCDMFRSFPDFFIDPIFIVHTDCPCKIVMSEVKMGGMQTGVFAGNPPNSKYFLIHGVLITYFDMSDKIRDIRLHYDSRSIYKQLGILKV